jgi:hypothetical protein
MLKHSLMAIASVMTVGLGVVNPAEAVSFTFEFDNSNASLGDGFVTGIVRGLGEDGTFGATSVEILTNTAGFGIGEYIGSPTSNTWTLAGGNLLSFDFVSFGSANSPPDVTTSSLWLTNTLSLGNQAGFLTNSPDFVGGRNNTNNLVFTRVVDPDPTDVPEPMSALALVAVGAVVAGGALKKKVAA